MAHTVLVTGASGLLGRAIFSEFSACSNWQTIGTGYSRCGEKLRKLDLLNTADIEALLDELKPDVVVHAAAERRPDFVEKEELATHKLNVDATACIARNVASRNGLMLYISTDYVFDGCSPPYKPSDLPNPLNKYGASKRAGELETLKYAATGCVLRLPVLYGRVEHLHESVVTGLYDILIKREPKEISDFEQRCPTLVDDIAMACRGMADQHVSGRSICGIWHFCGTDQLTKYGMIKEMASVFGCPMDHITGVKEVSPGAKRPYNCKFDCSDLAERGILKTTPFREGIKTCIDDFKLK